jgi:pyruvate/2-oxoglutarate dehydrogenase complex dihydrolipoamide acyltransferase (E2) component
VTVRLPARVQVLVKAGEAVEAGRPLAVLTAMKMETSINAPCDGSVSHIAVIKGDTIDAGDLIIRIARTGSGAASGSDASSGSEGAAEAEGAAAEAAAA